MIVRKLNADDVREHDKVSSQAFIYECDIDDKNSVLPSEIMLGAFLDDGKTLMADIEIGDRLCFYGNGTLRCAAVGGVASKSEHRGKGAVKAIFATLFNEPEWDISVLYPFSDAYYSRLGYESAGRVMKVETLFSNLTGVERNSEAILFEGENTETLLGIYNDFAKKTGLAFLRENTDEYSSNPYKSCQYTYVWNGRSYATFSVNRAEKTVSVKELVFSDKESLGKILGFLKNYEGNQDKLVFEKIPIDSPVMYFIADEKRTAQLISGTGAVRILNAENVLKKHRYPEEKGSFAIEIKDTVPRNNSVFEVFYENGKAEILLGCEKSPDISLNINAASKILLSGVNGRDEAEYINGVNILGDCDDFFRAFPKKEAFFCDEF